MKKLAITSVILLHAITVLCQQRQPVYRSAKDSVQFAIIRAKFEELIATKDINNLKPALDSLNKLQGELILKGIIGYRYVYQPNKVFTPYTDLEKGLVQPDEVRQLSIATRKDKRLPPLVFACKNLEEMELVNTSVEKLPRKLDKLAKLSTIEIYNNRPARRIKPAKNTNVTYLKIRGDKPEKLPASYKKFKRLDSLDLAENLLTKFPDINKNKTFANSP